MPALQTLLGVYLLRRYVCVLGKTVLCLSTPKLRFTVTSAAPDTQKQKRQSHWLDSFWRGASNQKNEPEAFFFFKWRFYAWRFSRRCAHSHWRPLFSHEALNVGEYHARNLSRCVRVLRMSKWWENFCVNYAFNA